MGCGNTKQMDAEPPPPVRVRGSVRLDKEQLLQLELQYCVRCLALVGEYQETLTPLLQVGQGACSRW